MPPTVLPLTQQQCDQIKQAYLDTYPEDAKLKEQLDQLFPPLPPPPNGTTMRALLEQFRQIIAYGPPGTGKTREAKRVALALLSNKKTDEISTDDEIEEELNRYRKEKRYDLVVFHPAYEYEQFIGGIEPTITEGKQLAFQPKAGIFLRLCRNAVAHRSSAVIIIDEINRGNLPKLLGELVYALEYRGHEVRLPFACDGDSTLVVLTNLYIIATMNSADRSIGLIDVAIRRRFGFYPLAPNPDVVRAFWRDKDDEYGVKLAKLMDELNAMLKKANDSFAELELGVGHSYFLPKRESSGEESKRQVALKWEFQVQPLLREYAQFLNLQENSLDRYLKNRLNSLLA